MSNSLKKSANDEAESTIIPPETEAENLLLKSILNKPSQDLLTKYELYRHLSGKMMGTQIIDHLSKESLQASAKKMGILRGTTMLFDDKHSMNVFWDYCMFYHLSNSGKNAIDRYISQHFLHLDENQKCIAMAMKKAELMVILVQETLPYGGVLVSELITETKYELFIDKNMNKSSVPGTILLTTALRFPDFIMTTGSSIFINNPNNDISLDILDMADDCTSKYGDIHKLTQEKRAALATRLFRTCFDAQAMEFSRTAKMSEA